MKLSGNLIIIGYSVIGNWIPSQFIGSGWKKFETPSNDLVDTFKVENDSIRLNNSISFIDYGWDDPYWKNKSSYPIISKYNDPNNGTNDFYQIRLADILLLKAEALVQKNDINGAMHAGEPGESQGKAGSKNRLRLPQMRIILLIRKEGWNLRLKARDGLIW